MITLTWKCVRCEADHTVATELLDCPTPGCQADVHSAWMECSRCGWETRVVRHSDNGDIIETHTQPWSGGHTLGTA